MNDLTSYRLSDFILFSQASYYRQFELYNQAIWPLHAVAIICILILSYMIWKRPSYAGRVVALLFVLSWVWVGYVFLYQWFYQIHVVADWYALGFVLQAGLIAWYGLIKNSFALLSESRFRMNIGLGLLIVSVFVYPFIALISGRSWMQFEMFALAPDPTVLATFAILLISKGSTILYVIPIIWILLSAMTLFVM